MSDDVAEVLRPDGSTAPVTSLPVAELLDLYHEGMWAMMQDHIGLLLDLGRFEKAVQMSVMFSTSIGALHEGRQAHGAGVGVDAIGAPIKPVETAP